MDNFDAHKWFKKQYLAEDSLNDQAKRYFLQKVSRGEIDTLPKNPKEEFLKQMMKDQMDHDEETLRRERGLEEIARVNMNSDEVFDRMEDLADRRKLSELKDLIYDLGEGWVAEGFDSLDIGEYLEDLVYKLVRS